MTRDTLRNARLSDLAELLKDQHARKVDVVVPSTKIRSDGGLWVIAGTDTVLDETGVTSRDGVFRPTAIADEGMAAKLNIPVAYLRRMRQTRPDLYDANVNGWLQGSETLNLPADGRSFLVRAFNNGEHTGVARAFLSDSYRIVDHLDVLTAALAGVRSAGVEVSVESADLTERRMYVKVASPAVAELAPQLLSGYRSPYSGREGDDNPTVFAGFVLSNSETGGGAFSITPRLVVQICSNGMTIAKDALRKTHLGGRMEEGVVSWSTDTLRKNLELVEAQARDAVAQFLHPDYLRAKIAQLSEGASAEAGVREVQTITKQLSYSDERIESVLDAFVKGGQTTLGGVAHAITAAAQVEPDADVAAQMEVEATELLIGA